jgi:hypothetical protein
MVSLWLLREMPTGEYTRLLSELKRAALAKCPAHAQEQKRHLQVDSSTTLTICATDASYTKPSRAHVSNPASSGSRPMECIRSQAGWPKPSKGSWPTLTRAVAILRVISMTHDCHTNAHAGEAPVADRQRPRNLVDSRGWQVDVVTGTVPNSACLAIHSPPRNSRNHAVRRSTMDSFKMTLHLRPGRIVSSSPIRGAYRAVVDQPGFTHSRQPACHHHVIQSRTVSCL